jgi:O-antigen ligase
MVVGKNIAIRSTIFGGNANDIGLRLSMAVFILMSLLFENKLKFGKFRYLLLIFFPFLLKFMFNTGSRVAFISFFLGVSIMFVVYIKSMGFTKKVNLLILGSFLMLLATVILFENDTIIRRLYIAFFKGDISGHDQIWSNVISIISKNLFIGVGETGLAQRMGGVSPHNVFLEVLACTGIVGFLIFFIFFCRILIGAYEKFKYQNELLPFVLFIPVIGAVLSGQIFEQKIYWVVFAFIISSSEIVVKTEE